jgi:hypothetical protein
MPLTRDVKKVAVGEGALFTAPGDTDPVEDSVGLFVGWDAPWVHPGLTNEGVNASIERDLNFHRVEEQSSPTNVSVNTSTLSFATALAEDVLDNLKLAIGGGVLAKVAAAAGQIGKTTFRPSDEVEVIAVGFEAKNTFGFFRRIYLPRAVSVGSVEMAYRRSESKRVFGTQLQSISDLQDVLFVDKTANATS